jgi:hypothetical protein
MHVKKKQKKKKKNQKQDTPEDKPKGGIQKTESRRGDKL